MRTDGIVSLEEGRKEKYKEIGLGESGSTYKPNYEDVSDTANDAVKSLISAHGITDNDKTQE